MARKIVGSAYALAGIAILITLIFGDRAFLSVGWIVHVADETLYALWHHAWWLCVAGLIGGGIVLGYRFALTEREDRQQGVKHQEAVRALFARELERPDVQEEILNTLAEMRETPAAPRTRIVYGYKFSPED